MDLWATTSAGGSPGGRRRFDRPKPRASPQVDPLAAVLCVSGSVEPLGQVDLDVVTVVLADGLAGSSGHRELVGAIAQRHERSREWVPVDGAGDLDQTTSSEDLC